MELFVSEAVLDVFDSPEVMAALADEDHAEEIERLSRAIEFGRNKLNDLLKDYATGLLTREQFSRAKTIVETDIEANQAELGRLRPTGKLPQQPLREVWDDLSIDMKLSIIRLVVGRVRVKPHPDGTKWKQWRFDWKKVEIDWRGGVVPQAAL